ncbi:DNA polymerase III subunit delta' [Exiguobacterium marinum]|uniref:DNA polymerase III subunit delta n=2 Tax=Exiguobacterium marinum TaxID=273528 RepID=A0ABY7WYG7_9BACL|nr:DNA polymerase III subunit delta' [Exiguobacterium marinum]WDH75908.1 DNA polymerase III subunit delta' [Exiguobacterium marinum]
MRFQELHESQTVVAQIIKNSIVSNKVGHAYIFSGDYEPFLIDTATLFAKALFCETPQGAEPCGLCRNCRRMDSKNIVDYIEVEPDGASIKKEQIQQLLSDLSLRGAEGDRQVYVIHQAHKMTTQAANSLLKFFEEPGVGKLAILVTTQPHLLLPTIRSRAQQLAFRPIDRAQLAQTMSEELSCTYDLAYLALTVYPKWDDAKEALGQEWFVQAYGLVVQLIEVLTKRPQELLLFAQEKWLGHFKGRNELRVGLELFEHWLEEALHLKVRDTYAPKLFKNEVALYNAFIQNRSVTKLTHAIESVHAAIRRLEANVNPQLTFERLSFDLQKG